MMSHTCTIADLTGHGSTGPIHGTGTQTACLVVGTQKLVLSTAGDTIVSPVGVYLPTGTVVHAGALVTLPETHGGSTHTVLSVQVAHTGLGTPDHVEIRLG
jgi:hypothetical protein